MLILAGLSGSLVVVFPALVLVFGQNYARIFGTAWAVQVFAVLVLLASYELAIRQIVGRRLEQGKTLPRWLLFWNAFVETSVPSILVLLGSRQVDPVYPLQSAATYLYAVFIVLSTLQLDFRLSVFTDAWRRRSMWSCRQWSSSGVGAGEGPRRADRDLSPCLIGRDPPTSGWETVLRRSWMRNGQVIRKRIAELQLRAGSARRV